MLDSALDRAIQVVEQSLPSNIDVASIFDAATCTASHIVSDSYTKRAAIIDSVLDFDLAAARTSTRSADLLVAYVRDQGLSIDWILETHAHADHLTAAIYLRNKLGGRIGISRHITEVQSYFGDFFHEDVGFDRDGAQFDKLFDDGEGFSIGEVQASVLTVPGHTPADIAYVIGDAAFVGDTLFMPDGGTARADFPGGDARVLYRSIRRLLSLPDRTRVFLCHDYKAPGRDVFAWETTVAAERAANIHVRDGVSEDAFVEMREARDRTLGIPRLILPAIQVNIRAGELPLSEQNGSPCLRLPLNRL